MSTFGPAPPPTFNAEEADNFEDIEKQFAVKVVKHLEAYWNLLSVKRGSTLKLTKYDDEIYEHFKKEFPEIDVSQTLDEDAMKSKAGKEKWRNFMNQYEKKIADFNFGTILRRNPKFEFGEHETLFAVRMQHYAVEIARNREGLNDWIYEKNHPEEKKE